MTSSRVQLAGIVVACVCLVAGLAIGLRPRIPHLEFVGLTPFQSKFVSEAEQQINPIALQAWADSLFTNKSVLPGRLTKEDWPVFLSQSKLRPSWIEINVGEDGMKKGLLVECGGSFGRHGIGVVPSDNWPHQGGSTMVVDWSGRVFFYFAP